MKSSEFLNLNWSTFITGGNIFGRKCLSLSACPIADVLFFLRDFNQYNEGIILSNSHYKQKLISGQGNVSKKVNINNLLSDARVYALDDLLNTDFCFVPYSGDDYPKTKSVRKLYEWAIEKGIPYVFQHDNDLLVFSMFPSSVENRAFSLFLSKSIFNINHKDIVIANADWKMIREGIYSHGWTLNRLQCSYDKGKLIYNLWAGVPSATIVARFDFKPPKNYNKRLTISIHENTASIKIANGKCPLEGTYGELEIQP